MPWRVVSLNRPVVAVLCAVLVGTGLAGCIDEPEIEPEGPVETGPAETFERDGRDLRTDLREDDELGVPAWQVGQWFGLHVYFEVDGFEDDWHFDVVVVEEASDHYVTATPNEAVAKEHAMWDYPALGEIEKADLSFTGVGADWDWMYDFPLSHEKTWTRDMELISFEGEITTIPVTFTATYAAAIETTQGNRPGFQIEGRAENGTLVVEYDFVPAVGWFAHMWIYEGVDDPLVHVMSMGFGQNWTGTYYVYEAELLVEHVQLVGVDPLGGGVYAQPDPYQAFTVSEDADFVTGMIFAGAFAGAQALLVVDPEGGVRDTILLGAPAAFEFQFFEEPAIPGEWRLAALGAGAFALSFLMLWELSGEAYTM